MPDRTKHAENAGRVLDLFAEARELPFGERAGYLERACAGEKGLIEEVQSLLRYESPAEGFLAKPVIDSGAAILAEEAGGSLDHNTMLDDYRIVSLLGAGGMGEVYLAEDTVHGRRVALKLIGKDRAADVRGRHFRHERRVLAGLNHPFIARLYGSGVTPEGQAYLVMEHVEGERLDKYHRARHLDVGARLTLFRQVCAAVTHAHQNLVVHRDLKPANIRVTPTGEPKLLDFGIAKLLDPGNESAKTDLPTMTMGAMMTPEYASPEQLRGEASTTAGDVYSLGVILYEMLCGQRPYRFKNRQPEEIARTICEQEPRRLSTVIAHGAATAEGEVHEGSPARLRRQLEGDLDNIVAMALRKEPTRRYASVAQFSDDVRRHCEGLPVAARRDTLGYRTGKFARRNAVAVSAAAAVLLALVGGLAVTTWQMRVARAERDRARHAEQQAGRINRFLQNLLSSASPGRRGHDVKVVDVLDDAAKNLDRDLADDPESLAQAHVAMGRTYKDLAILKPAEEQLRAAVEGLRCLHGDADPALLDLECDLASVTDVRGQSDQAQQMMRDSLAIQQRRARPDAYLRGRTLFMLAQSLAFHNHPREAEPMAREGLDLIRKARGETDPTFVSYQLLPGNIRLSEFDYEGAMAEYRRAIALMQRYAPNSSDLVSAEVNLCTLMIFSGNVTEVEAPLRRAQADCQRVTGDTNSRNRGILLNASGQLAFRAGDYTTALSLSRQAIDVLTACGVPRNGGSRLAAYTLAGVCLTRTGHPQEGEPYLRTAYEDGQSSPTARAGGAGPLSYPGRPEDPAQWRESYAAALARSLAFPGSFGNVSAALGECLLAQKRYAEAEPLLLSGYDELKQILGESHVSTAAAARQLRDLSIAWKTPGKAMKPTDDGELARSVLTP